MKGFEQLTVADIERRNLKISEPKRSKYRNVKVEIHGEKFDSKREASYWLLLKAREAAGEITDLKRQQRFPLYAPILQYSDDGTGRSSVGGSQQVAEYVSDFTFREQNVRHVVDAKGKRTAIYQLKKKWLELQDGIIVEEV